MNSGDRNIKYFHYFASFRRHTNFINGLKNLNGEWYSEHQSMVSIVHEYFTTLFSYSNPSSQDIANNVDSIGHIVDIHMNDVLCTLF